MKQYSIEIKREYPPNISEIRKVFPRALEGDIVFAHYPYIYAPTSSVPPIIYEHESVHIDRQVEVGVDLWWNLYLTDDRFRYEEELLAHRAEYLYSIQKITSSKKRLVMAKITAKRLISPLYRYDVTYEKALRDILTN